jgi:hypothetical protein
MVTTEDMVLAESLLKANEAYANGRKHQAIEALAKTLAAIHDRAVACTTVRLENGGISSFCRLDAGDGWCRRPIGHAGECRHHTEPRKKVRGKRSTSG